MKPEEIDECIEILVKQVHENTKAIQALQAIIEAMNKVFSELQKSLKKN